MSNGGRGMSSWYPKEHGFESGSSGNSSFGKARTRRARTVPDFWQYRLGVLVDLAEKGIPHYEKEDGTIVADIPGCGKMQMTPEMQKENHQRYVDRLRGKEVPSNV